MLNVVDRALHRPNCHLHANLSPTTATTTAATTSKHSISRSVNAKQSKRKDLMKRRIPMAQPKTSSYQIEQDCY